ncbi:LysR family transcriptional regulator [Xanthomonas cannabis]|uniref:LysR family transcriptional regulator n=1 Tax=Xanthomonas cannabis TaxID=1885674 RepID=UPI001ABA2205|nr:LysR family transcriptional regulator [Xanthomonas cannabis]NIK17056.1 DNA-binding transcriptional LysR family regulator [Xanthomonas cannabis]
MKSVKLDFNSLRIFVASAQKGSFTLAAKSLDMPLPTVSRRMLELERDLQTQLFERSTRGCTVTEAGARLLAQVAPGIEMLSEFESTSVLESPTLSGRLRLSLPQSFRPIWQLLGTFQRENPNIRVSVYSTERRVDLLADGVDVALRVGPISDDSVVARHVASFRHVLVASPEMATRAADVREPQDVHSVPCATWGSAIDERPVWRLGGSAISVEPGLMVNDYLHLRDRAIAGDFLTELPSFLAAEPLRNGHLVEVLPNHPFPQSPIHLVYRRLRHPRATVRSYVDFCAEQLPAYIDAQ